MIYYELVGDKWVEIAAEPQDLVLRLPYVFSSRQKIIPPLLVLNSILRSGEFNVGMSGRFKWNPMEMTTDDYDSLKQKLLKKSYRDLEPTPGWVDDYKTWHIWKLEKTRGIDSEQHLKFVKQINALEEKLRVATESNKKNMVDILRVEKYNIQMKLRELTEGGRS